METQVNSTFLGFPVIRHEESERGRWKVGASILTLIFGTNGRQSCQLQVNAALYRPGNSLVLASVKG